MADLDRELLLLAGDDSSDDEQPQNTTVITKVESVSPPTERPRDFDNSTPSSRVNATPKTGSKSRGKNGADAHQSEEEGEASGSSLDSAPMSESEGGQSPRSNASDSIFPVEGKFNSEKDKAYIMSLPEIEREAILAERADIVQRKTQDQILRKLYEGYTAKEGERSKAADQKKRKAGTAELEDVQRKSSRQKTTLGGRKVGETSDAMEAYKRQREQKGIIAEQRKHEAAERKARKGHGSVSDGSDADADGESEVEWDDPKTRRRSVSGPRDEPLAELVDYERVRVARDNFAKYCFYPGFEQAMKNCYVRLAIGPDKAGEMVYRMCEIKGFTEGKPYAIEGSNSILFTTTQYVSAAIGKSVREMPFIMVSNSKFAAREFDRYKVEIVNAGLTLPTKAFLISKIRDIERIINHRLTDGEIQEKLRRSGVLERKKNQIERTQLVVERKDAEYRKDEAALARINAALAALEGPKLAFGTSLYKAVEAPKGKSQQERLAEINKANRKANTRDVRRAQIAERKRIAELQAAVERGEAVPDAFARVKVRAKTHHDVNAHLNVPKPKGVDDLFSGSDASRGNTPAPGSGINTPKKESTPAITKNLEITAVAPAALATGKGVAFRPSQCIEEEALASMDFGIDIDVL